MQQWYNGLLAGVYSTENDTSCYSEQELAGRSVVAQVVR